MTRRHADTQSRNVTPPFYRQGKGRFFLSLFFCASILALPVKAQESAPSQNTQIITDQESGSVTIVIDGEPMLLVDKTGLHVVGNITYGGTIADVGSEEAQNMIHGKIEDRAPNNKEDDNEAP